MKKFAMLVMVLFRGVFSKACVCEQSPILPIPVTQSLASTRKHLLCWSHLLNFNVIKSFEKNLRLETQAPIVLSLRWPLPFPSHHHRDPQSSISRIRTSRQFLCQTLAQLSIFPLLLVHHLYKYQGLVQQRFI